MPGMRRNSRTIHLIESSLHRFEIESETTPASPEIVLLARSVLDELRRLENKWRAQVAAGSPRRIDADFRTLQGWYKRWLAAARTVSRNSNPPALEPEIREIQSAIEKSKRLRRTDYPTKAQSQARISARPIQGIPIALIPTGIKPRLKPRAWPSPGLQPPGSYA
jgi:hypothetical protein